MKLLRKVGVTSEIWQIFIRDSSSTTGAGLTGLAFNTASLTAYYHRDTDTTATAMTLVTMTVGTFTSLGFKEVDATNLPGVYQLCPPNAALASGAKSCVFLLKGATNMAPLPIEVDLDGQVDVTHWNGTAVTAPNTAGTPVVDVGRINNVATSSVTTISANQGTTQPLNFTGTAGSALVKSDMVDVAGAAVSTTTAQIGVNVVNWTGTAVLTPAVAGSPLVNVIRSGTAQGGSGNTITLDASASATNTLYKGLKVWIVSGTGAGQVRTIITYTGSTKAAVVDWPWLTSPDNTSVFALIAADNPALNSTLQVSMSNARVVIRSGTAQTGSTSTTVKLDSGASATSNLYNGDLLTITGGTGIGQTRTVISYAGSTKIATVDKPWNTTPDATSTFDIYASTTPSVFSDQGVAQAGGATSITLAATASASNSVYNGSIVTILAGTGAGGTAEITAYNGTTKVATTTPAWAVNPDSTSVYAVIPTDSGTGSIGTQNVNVTTWASGPVSYGSAPFVQLADGVAHGGTLGSSTATLALNRIVLQSNTADTLTIKALSSGSSGYNAVSIYGDPGGGAGVYVQGGDGGGDGVDINAGDTGIALRLFGGAISGQALHIETVDGHCISIFAAGTGKHGIVSTGGTNGDGVRLVGAGTGHDISLAGSGNLWDAVNTQDAVARPKARKNIARTQQFPMTTTAGAAALLKTVTVQRSLDGAAYANCTAVTATEISGGDYKILLSAADRNGDRTMYRATATGCNPTQWEIDSDGT